MTGEKHKMLIDKKIFYKNLIRLALPIALQSLMLAAVAAGDALMLGKVAQDEMTAVSLATQIQFVQNMFLGAITAAISCIFWVHPVERYPYCSLASVPSTGCFMVTSTRSIPSSPSFCEI